MSHTTLSTLDYADLVRQTGGKVIILDGNAQTCLAPLKVSSRSRDLMLDPANAVVYNSETIEQYRSRPEMVFLLPRPVIYASGIPVIANATTEVLYRHQKFLTHIVDEPPCRHLAISPPPLLLGPLESYNYSHWVFEGLPKIGLYRKAFGRYPEKVLIPTRCRNFHIESIGFISKDIEVVFQTKFPVTAHACVVTTSLAQTVSKINPSVFRFFDEIVEASPTDKSGARIYISRKNASHRRIINEEELISGLQKFGFKPVLPEDMSFAEQVSVFRDAECIISPHGAGLTNLIFSKSLKFVAEIFPSGFAARSAFAHATRHKQAEYLMASGMPMELPESMPQDPQGRPNDRSFVLDTRRFLNAVDASLAVLF